MRTKIGVLIVLFLAVTGIAVAQNSKVKYQGNVEVGYSVGVGNFGLDRINLHTIQGIRVGKYFSTGVGIGLDYYHSYDRYVNPDYTDSELSMPIFWNGKGYLPVSKKASLFFSMDIGASIGLTDGMSDMKGLLLTPALGMSFTLSGKKAITFSLGYNYQEWSESILTINDDAISVKVGFQF